MAPEEICRRCLCLLRRQSYYGSQLGRSPTAHLPPSPGRIRHLSSGGIRREAVTPARPQTASEVPLRPRDPGALKDASPVLKLAHEVRQRAPNITETYVAYGVTDKLYKECATQADYSVPQASEKDGEIPKTAAGVDLGVGEGWWYKELKLTPTFNTWAQITMLHIYLFATRFRHFPPAHSPTWQQHLLDHFFFDAERRMMEYHRMTASMTRKRHLKDLFVQYRGAMVAYDHGLCQTDAVLATALWRNVFAADPDVDLRALACVVAHVRRTVAALALMSDDEIATGRVRFADLARDWDLVKARSPLLDSPLPPAPVSSTTTLKAT